jgi:hypothetical protein
MTYGETLFNDINETINVGIGETQASLETMKQYNEI